jgi:hypothetical protein
MEDRRDERHGLIVNGRYRTGRGLPMDIVLHDLSKSGCQIHDRLGHLEVGQFLTIRIGPIGPIEAHVRWLEGRKAGIQFDSPLNDAVLEHICSIAQPMPSKPKPAAEVTREPYVNKLELDDRERRFAEAIGALDIDPGGFEVLAGLVSAARERLTQRKSYTQSSSRKPTSCAAATSTRFRGRVTDCPHIRSVVTQGTGLSSNMP